MLSHAEDCISDGLSAFRKCVPFDVDAIVVGSGLTGSLASRELTSSGLNVLLVERGGRDFKDGCSTLETETTYFVQRRCGAFGPATKKYFVRDDEHVYRTERGHFSWIRGYQLGGRSLTWSGHCYRLGPADFDVVHPDSGERAWPIEYRDIAPWYSTVEPLLQLVGQQENWEEIPDSIFYRSPRLNPDVTQVIRRFAEQNPKGKKVTPARMASSAQRYADCELFRGAIPIRPGLYTALSGALPEALSSTRLRVLTSVICEKVLLNRKTGLACGIRVVDSITKERCDLRSKIVFLCASTIPTTQILLNSKCNVHPNGLGNNRELVGCYLMDHLFQCGAEGFFFSHGESRSSLFSEPDEGLYVPRSTSPWQGRGEFCGTYGFQGAVVREKSSSDLTLRKLWLGGWGETKPVRQNRITLSEQESDRWGIPIVVVSHVWSSEDLRLKNRIVADAAEILAEIGCQGIKSFDLDYEAGLCVHEMGTARMGSRPETSVLNPYNQIHECPNVFVTDGSCMPASPCQNPTLTYMALTARACAHAVECLKKQSFKV